jgi:hypothetical protein
VLRDGPLMPGETNATCMRLVGPVPRTNPSLAFDVYLEIENQNYVAMPVSEVLLGLNLFPDEPAPWPGVACMALCPADKPFCWAESERRPCEGARQGVPSERDYGGAHADLIFARGVFLTPNERPRLEQAVVPARGRIRITARFGMVPGALIEVLSARARAQSGVLQRGQPLSLDVPFELDGAVYVSTESGKHLGQAFGPVRGTWPLSGTIASARR